ncbi:hypothetical protein Tco_0616940, partial [Tanacetum coccineum]
KLQKSKPYRGATEHRDLKEAMSSSSKGTKFQPKSSGNSMQAEEPMFETADTEMLQDRGGDLGNTKD